MMQFRNVLLSLGLLGGLVLGSAVFADDKPTPSPGVVPAANNQPQPTGVSSGAPPSGQTVKPNTNPLNLDPEQQKALAALRQEQMAAMHKLSEMRSQLMDISYSDTYDQAKIDEIANNIAEASKKDMVEHAKHANAFYASLSPEQKKTFKEFESRRQKMQGKMMSGGQPMHRPPSPMRTPADKPAQTVVPSPQTPAAKP